MFMCVKLNSLLDRERKVLYVTQVLKQGINIKTICPNYKFRNTKLRREKLSLRIVSVKLLAIVIIVFKCFLVHIV